MMMPQQQTSMPTAAPSPAPMPGAGPAPMPGAEPQGAPSPSMSGASNPVVDAFKTLMLLTASLEQAGHPDAQNIKSAVQNLLMQIQGVGEQGMEQPPEMGPEMSMGPTGGSMGPTGPQPVDMVSGRSPSAKPTMSKTVPVM